MRTRLTISLLVVLVFGQPFAAAQDEPALVPVKELATLERTARDLAKAGVTAEAVELTDTLQALGLPASRITRLREAADKHAGSGGKAALLKKGPRAAKTIRRAVEKLAALLPDAGNEDRLRLAGLLVELDDSCAAAQKVLGREKSGGRWITPEEKRLSMRRAAIQEAIRSTRSLELALATDDRAHALVEKATGKKGHRVACRGYELHGTLPPHRLRRILRESIRASAFGNFLISGALEVPRPVKYAFILLNERADYYRALEAAHEMGIIPKREDVELSKKLSAWRGDVGDSKLCLYYAKTEGTIEACYFSYILGPTHWNNEVGKQFALVQPCLAAGLYNIVCMSYLGVQMAPWSWYEKDTEYSRRTLADPVKETERLQLLFPRAGLSGNLRRMVYLIREGRDPPWVRAMADQLGKVEGDNLVKTTCVVSYLTECGPILPLCLATYQGRKKFEPGTPLPLFEKALGQPIAEFEERFKRWMLRGDGHSLQKRLARGSGPNVRELTANEKKALAALNQVRKQARQPEAGFDRELSADCASHALYLAKHPDQASRWPEAHEEFPDREGFSTGGAWAGGHAVIAPGITTPEQAMDGWMGTFYHRLPLIHPGLLMIGWGFEKSIAVMDTDSLRLPVDVDTLVFWPPDGAKSVPIAFRAEMPNPVPGEDQSKWGYPVTLQSWWLDDGLGRTIEMSLHAGKANGPEVPCHFSSPDSPTNPELAPQNAWCLIPKQRLAPNTKYTVVAVIKPDGRQVWSFTTGSGR